MTVRMLVEGHSDNASAKRMGVSTRTYAGYVASLKTEYNVETRFQLGYAIGQQEERRATSATGGAARSSECTPARRPFGPTELGRQGRRVGVSPPFVTRRAGGWQ